MDLFSSDSDRAIAIQLERIADALDRAFPRILLPSNIKQGITLIQVDPEEVALAEQEAEWRKERGLPAEAPTEEPRLG